MDLGWNQYGKNSGCVGDILEIGACTEDADKPEDCFFTLARLQKGITKKIKGILRISWKISMKLRSRRRHGTVLLSLQEIRI